MIPLKHVERVLFGLPPHDSVELMEAKEYRPSPVDHLESGGTFDLYSREFDPFLLGAIEPAMNADDLRKTGKLEEEVKAISLHASAVVLTLGKNQRQP